LTVEPRDSFCPYVGLRPYTERDRAYFFGRERDTRVIASNLHAAPVTVLYGASGVGKSSVLMAGVLPHLRSARRTAAVLLRDWQSHGFVQELKARCLEAVGEATGRQLAVETVQPLDAFLQVLGDALGGTIVVILDQFEEYLLYHPTDQEGQAFDVELARAINRDDVDCNVLISLREDGLAGLDRFRARIPNLLSNMLRLNHMDLASAETAIRRPVEIYNEKDRGEASPVTIEDDLVQAVLADVRTGQVKLSDRHGSGQVHADADSDRIETPFLQLVLERLWQADVQAGPRKMRLETYRRLGGAQTIVSSHLGDVMHRLNGREQAMCAAFFDRLVTPSGTKIAYSVSDLAQFARGNEREVAAILDRLTDARILRTVEARAGDAARRVEIFHDVMAPAVLQWVGQFAQRRARRQRFRRMVGAASLVLLVLGFVGYRYYELWLTTRPWAHLENLATGTVYALRANVVSVGRSTERFTNTIGLRPETISRMHLLIYGNGGAHDMRSLNGTTVNAKFLRYGDIWHPNDGDIVTLAGLAPFRYRRIEYGRWQFWEPPMRPVKPPPDAWGMIMDGSARAVTYLSGDVYYLSLDSAGHVVLSDQESDTWLMIIRVGADRMIAIEDRADGVDLVVQMKEGDYQYPTYVVPPGTRHRQIVTRVEPHDLFEVAYRYRDTHFQLIRLIPDLEQP
jgi:conflict system STAND superfamily ATPase/FHA domain-containing protein